jgi:hypothetical protein
LLVWNSHPDWQAAMLPDLSFDFSNESSQPNRDQSAGIYLGWSHLFNKI